MSHTVALEIKVQEGKIDEFLEFFVPALNDTRAREGCELIECYVDSGDDHTVLVWEKWDNEANQQAYLAWRGETGFIDKLGPFLAGAPTFTTYLAKD